MPYHTKASYAPVPLHLSPLCPECCVLLSLLASCQDVPCLFLSCFGESQARPSEKQLVEGQTGRGYICEYWGGPAGAPAIWSVSAAQRCGPHRRLLAQVRPHVPASGFGFSRCETRELEMNFDHAPRPACAPGLGGHHAWALLPQSPLGGWRASLSAGPRSFLVRGKHTVSSWVEGGFSEARDWADSVGVS